MGKLIDFNSYAIGITLKKLLEDKSAKRNIIWATNTYESLGSKFAPRKEMTVELFESGFVLESRIRKCEKTQHERTKASAEVFTPSWIVNKMNNFCDEEWFGRNSVFNEEQEGKWKPTSGKISFEGKNWQDYITLLKLEITCGEAPFVVSRYDASTGEKIHPTFRRMGFLDRKLRIVNENTKTKKEWIHWAKEAVKSSYGYEYQGDNLLIARMNILLTFVEYFEERWKEEVEKDLLLRLATIISWNFWQMDGLTDTVPFGLPLDSNLQFNLFDLLEETEEDKKEDEPIPCRIYNWSANRSVLFTDFKEKRRMKKFDYVIGNPPYQDEMIGESTQSPPIYHLFTDQMKKISDKVMLITPARFLFNAGATPKAWNRKMLNSEHLKIKKYVQDSSEVFPNTDIKGGVTVFYLDRTKKYRPVKVFTAFRELNSIINKMLEHNYESLSKIMCGQNTFKLTDQLHIDYPEAEEKLSKGHKYDLTTSIFRRLPEVFYDESQNSSEYMRIIGREKGQRVFKWIKKDYIRENEVLHTYKVILPSANGSGAIGEVLSTPLIGEPLIGEPLIGYTQTFSSIGFFKTRDEAEACLKYIKTKFARCLLGILKVTQHNPPVKWKYVPLQDFTENSDIDWSLSIPEIDQELYKKYNLSQEEIHFIEEKVQAMD